MRIVQRNTTTYPIPVLMVLASDHVSGATGKTLTVNVSKNGAAFASFSGTISELSYGWYSLVIAVGDVDTLGTLAIHVDASGCDPVDLACQVVAFNPADAVRLGLSSLPNETAGAVNGLPLGDGSGRVLLQPTQTGVTIPTVTDLTTKTGFSLSSDGILAIWHELVASVTQVGSLGALLRDTLDAAVSSRADQTVVQSAMTAQGYTSIRAGYLDVLNGLVSAIWGAASRTLTAISDSAGVTTLLSRISAALSFTSGRVNAQVGGMDANTLTNTALSTAAVSEIQSGLSTLDYNSVVFAVQDSISAIGLATTNQLNARTIEAADYATASAVAAITTIVNRLNTMLELAGTDYRFTVAALANAPNSGSGGATAGEIADAVLDELISAHTVSGSLSAIISAIKARTDLIVSSQIKYASNFDPITSTLTLVRGNTPTIQFPVTGDWTGATNIKLGIRKAGEDGTSPIYSIAGSVVGSTTLAVTFPAEFGIDPELQVGNGYYEWDLTGKLASNEVRTPYAQSPFVLKDRIAQVS